jgi:hypothetical protein
VPNLLNNEDTEAIGAALRPIMQGLGMTVTKMTIYNFFVSRVRAMLHVVLGMSPIGDAFRQRLRYALTPRELLPALRSSDAQTFGFALLRWRRWQLESGGLF